jgi:hypothetical protein
MPGIESVCGCWDGKGDAVAALGRMLVVPDSRFLKSSATLEEQVVEGEKFLLALTEVDESGPNEGRVVACRP